MSKNTATTPAAPDATRDDVTWNASGRPSRRNAIDSPSRTTARTELPRRGDDLRQPAVRSSSVREAISDLVAVAMDLDPRAVELPVDRGLAELPHRLSAMVDGDASIGPTGRPTSSANDEPRLALAQDDLRHHPRIAPQHRRPVTALRGSPVACRPRRPSRPPARPGAAPRRSARAGTPAPRRSRARTAPPPPSRRAACDPGPLSSETSCSTRSTSPIVSVASRQAPAGPPASASPRPCAAGAARPTGTRRPARPRPAPARAASRPAARPSPSASAWTRRRATWRRGRRSAWCPSSCRTG